MHTTTATEDQPTLILTAPPERRTKPGLTESLLNPAWTAGQTSPTSGLWAAAQIGSLTVEVSKLDGESGWTIDAAYAGSRPIYVNGYGARYLRTRPLRDVHAATLDAVVGEVAR